MLRGWGSSSSNPFILLIRSDWKDNQMKVGSIRISLLANPLNKKRHGVLVNGYLTKPPIFAAFLPPSLQFALRFSFYHLPINGIEYFELPRTLQRIGRVILATSKVFDG